MSKSRIWLLVSYSITIILIIGTGAYEYNAHSKKSFGTKASPTQVLSSSPTNQTPICLTADQAASDDSGNSGCVQFTGYAYTSPSGQMYLDQSTSAPYGFSAWIPSGSSFGQSILEQYSGKEIDVTGSIISYRSEPEIVINDPSQITLAQ